MNSTSRTYARHLVSRIEEALLDTPVVMVAGPRQSGKTTLVRSIARQQGLRYMTLDDPVVRVAAQQDPVGMVRALGAGVIDEIQRAPELLLAIKQSVDEDRRAGRFLVTGSADVMALPKVADSLAGRMETLLLLPLSQSEIEGSSANWIDAAFSGRVLCAQHHAVGDALIARVLRGGYPEALTRASYRRRTAWARQYMSAMMQRDVRDVAEVTRLDDVPRLLRVLGQSAGQMCNYARSAAEIGLDAKTAARYVGVLEHLYLLRRVEPYASNRLSRVVKTPKVQFLDSGLLAALTELSEEEAQRDRSRFGAVLESFVFAELFKHLTTAEGAYHMMYYRDADGAEVDTVIENAPGDVVGVEVKASATLHERDVRGLRKLAGLVRERFRLGVVLYDGTQTIPLGEGIWAAPIASLWGNEGAIDECPRKP